MRKTSCLAIAFSLFFIVLLAACAPQPTQPPPTKQATAQPSPAKSVSTPITQEDTDWAKVLEAAKKEGKLTLYSYNLVGDVGLSVAKAFRERYGITIDIVTGRGAEFLERLKTERRMGRLVADISDGTPVLMMNMKVEGLTMSLAEKSPVFREQGVWLTDVFANDPKDKHLAGLSLNYWSPWINTKQVAPGDVPQVWLDLLKPQWKGKMILTEPTVSAGPQQYFVPLIREKVIDEDFLKSLYKQDVLLSSSLMDEARMLGRGDRVLSIRGSVATLAKFVAEGAPIKAVDMKDGIVQLVSPTVVILSGGPHPNAARLFANWFLSREGHTIYSRAASAPPIRRDVPDSTPEAARLTPQRPVLQTPEDNDKAQQLYRERWLDKLWGR